MPANFITKLQIDPWKIRDFCYFIRQTIEHMFKHGRAKVSNFFLVKFTWFVDTRSSMVNLGNRLLMTNLSKTIIKSKMTTSEVTWFSLMYWSNWKFTFTWFQEPHFHFLPFKVTSIKVILANKFLFSLRFIFLPLLQFTMQLYHIFLSFHLVF